jgi:uncharacterized membrane protein YhaH (DUF805 family)
MTFAESIRTVLNKYSDFSGRARRSEYWWWALALVLAGIVISIISRISWPLGLILDLLLFFATIVPGLAVGVRRLHDTGKSGWWLLIGFVPCVGFIVLLVFFVTDSEPVPNEYGPPPKAVAPGY